MGSLKGKVALVTGAGRGIGAQIVKRFAEEGADVYANARTEGSLDDVCAELSGAYDVRVKPLYFDVNDDVAAGKAVLSIRREAGRLDVLVNNAGIMHDAVIGMIGRKMMEETFSTNVYAVMNMIQLADKLMRDQNSGSMINISSIAGTKGIGGQMLYSASKGAVTALTKAAAKELAARNIRVNAIAPGMIDTELFRSIGEERVKERLGSIGLGRFGTTEDVADAAVFLASDMSSYITGEILGVDGGVVI